MIDNILDGVIKGTEIFIKLILMGTGLIFTWFLLMIVALCCQKIYKKFEKYIIKDDDL